MRARGRNLATHSALILMLAVALLCGCGENLGDDTRAADVRRGDIEATVDVLGRVEPKRQLALSTRLSGEVQQVLVTSGQDVVAGDLLLQLDARESLNAIEQAKRSVEAQRLQLEQALQAPSASDIDLATARLRRATVLRQRAQDDYNEIADQSDAETSDEASDLESAKLEYEIAKAEFDRTMEGTSSLELDRLRLNLEGAELALQQANEQLEYTRIRAPISGTILAIDAREGENVYGFNPLIQIADLSLPQIRAEIDEIDIASIAEGQSVVIRLDAFPTQILEGTIVRVPPGPDLTRGTTIYEAFIAFDAQSQPVRPGMGANLTITIERVENALLVPRQAVRRVGRNQVVRVVGDRRESEVIVLTGVSNESEIQILSGLEEGQTILLE
ncbi:MAG: hypothetical protein A2Y73_00845 [Chloroflexi bacterium RBG_13_56_8]|nr:MAG: hypothetical protein A2Y73_00845 [Chloroflexi bacterium RBG_13_56_8]